MTITSIMCKGTYLNWFRLSHLNGGRWTVEGEVNTIKEIVKVRGNFNITNL